MLFCFDFDGLSEYEFHAVNLFRSLELSLQHAAIIKSSATTQDYNP
jgi:hypothetical protein